MSGTSLAVRWLRTCLARQVLRFHPWVGNWDPTSLGATEPTRQKREKPPATESTPHAAAKTQCSQIHGFLGSVLSPAWDKAIGTPVSLDTNQMVTLGLKPRQNAVNLSKRNFFLFFPSFHGTSINLSIWQYHSLRRILSCTLLIFNFRKQLCGWAWGWGDKGKCQEEGTPFHCSSLTLPSLSFSQLAPTKTRSAGWPYITRMDFRLPLNHRRGPSPRQSYRLLMKSWKCLQMMESGCCI